MFHNNSSKVLFLSINNWKTKQTTRSVPKAAYLINENITDIQGGKKMGPWWA